MSAAVRLLGHKARVVTGEALGMWHGDITVAEGEIRRYARTADAKGRVGRLFHPCRIAGKYLAVFGEHRSAL